MKVRFEIRITEGKYDATELEKASVEVETPTAPNERYFSQLVSDVIECAIRKAKAKTEVKPETSKPETNQDDQEN